MPLYEVLETSYINDRLVLAGTIIDYTPPPAQKPSPDASEEEKSQPHYQKTTVGKNLRLVKSTTDTKEIPMSTVTRPD